VVLSGSDADDAMRRRVDPPKTLTKSCAKDIRALRTSQTAQGCQCTDPA
jgi:hypothetical protein